MKRDGMIPLQCQVATKTMREINLFNAPSVRLKEPVSAYSPEPVTDGSLLKVLLTPRMGLLQMAIAVTSPSFSG